MKKFIYNFLRRIISIVLTHESGNTVHASLFKFKNKHKWIFKLFYGTVNDEEIFNNIIQKLDGKLDILMIHSSFNSMIPMYTGNLNNLLSKILEYCEQSNVTLVMPAFFKGSIMDAKKYYEDGNHKFDVKNSFSQMGLLSEIFRRTTDVKRSIHPTHSICALGPLAYKLTENHHNADSTFGDRTPFTEMIKHQTMILGIGTKGDQSLTQIHVAEDIMKSEYPINLYSGTIPVNCIDEFGNSFVYNLRIKKRGDSFNVKTIKKILNKSIMKWKYKGIPFYLAQADVVTAAIIDAARNGQTVYKRR